MTLRAVFRATSLAGLVLSSYLCVTTALADSVYFTQAAWGRKVEKYDVDYALRESVIIPPDVVSPYGLAVVMSTDTLYWTDIGGDSRGIHMSDLDGSNIQTLLDSSDGMNSPWEIAVDADNGKMYWTHNNTVSPTRAIMRADLDGSNKETILLKSSSGHYVDFFGIDLDPINNKVYWTDNFSFDVIGRCNLDGSDPEVLLDRNDDAGPSGIAVDPVNELIFWAEYGTGNANEPGAIWQAELDGSNPQLVYQRMLTVPGTKFTPHGIAVDPDTQWIYFTVAEPESIERVRYDGSDWEGLLSGNMSFPPFVALDTRAGPPPPPPIPEPSTGVLLALGLLWLIGFRWRKTSSASRA